MMRSNLASNELMKARLGRKVLVLLTAGKDQGSKTNLQNSIESVCRRLTVIVYSIVASVAEFLLVDGRHLPRETRVFANSPRIRKPNHSREIHRGRLDRHSSRSLANFARNMCWAIFLQILAGAVRFDGLM